jgi:NitT/TauT family transport system substrate-binding protein
MRAAGPSRGGLLVALVLLTAGLPAAAAPPVDTVSVAFLPVQNNGALFIAEKEGFFSAERIKIDWPPFPGGASQFIPVLLQGRLDVGAGAVSAAFFNAVAAGQKVRLAADKGHVAGRGTAGSVIVRKDLAGVIKSPADLKGRTVSSISRGALGHYLLYRLMARVGLTLDHVTVVTMPFAASIAALEAGSLDATILPAPFDTQAVERGVGVRFLDVADVIPNEPTHFIFMGPRLLEHNRSLGVRFLIAYLRGVRVYSAGPTARNVATVSEYTGVAPQVIQNSGWIGIHGDGYVDIDRLRRYQDWLYDIGLVNVRNPIAMVVDTTLLEQARTHLGIPQR